MYDSQALDLIGDAESRAENTAFQDRMRYKPFIEAAERYAAENGLIVGDLAATRLLIGGNLALDSFEYDFFSGQALTHAKGLGDVLYRVDPTGLGHYTAVLTKVPGYLFTVQVDGREMFTITALQPYRGIQIRDLVIPDERPAEFSEGVRLKVLGPELQLIAVYASLCNPGKVGSWAELFPAEASLREILRRTVREKISSSIARARAKGGARPQAAKFSQRLLEEFAAGPGRVLIGGAAISLLRGERVEDSRIQLIAVDTLETVAEQVSAIGKRAGYELYWRIEDPKIPTEPRLRRLTVSVQVGGGQSRRETVLDVYNAGAFEAIPFIELDSSPIKVGTPFVLMRFRLIDMWTIQVLMELRAIDIGYAKGVLHEMLEGYESAAALLDKMVLSSPERVAPRAAYVGRIEDPELALKRAAAAKANRFYPPYYPAAASE